MSDMGLLQQATSKAQALVGMSGARHPGQTVGLEDIRRVNAVLLPMLLASVLAVVWVGWGAKSTGAVLIWALACICVGALTGFLFGIPRAAAATAGRAGTVKSGAVAGDAQGAKAASGTRPNTNLEEVSDWLTKIIVGLTLVNLGEIQKHVQATAQNAAAALADKPADFHVSVATALIVAFSVLGFLGGYLYTRLFLQGAIQRSDSELDNFSAAVADVLTSSLPKNASLPADGEPAVPSASERASADVVARALPPDRPEAVLAPLGALAREYLSVRANMKFGPERTQKMAEIVARMRPFAGSATAFLRQLSASSSEGERLVAVVVVQMAYDPAWIEWLADRLWQEPAFIGYQSASILLDRLPKAPPQEAEKIRTAVKAAQARLPYAEDKRDKLIAKILEPAHP